MNVSGLFIRRPVATSLLALAVLFGGVLGYRLLPVSSLPQVDFPTIEVTTRLPGASAETTSKLVTAPLERQLGQIQGLSSMISTSARGRSKITLQFALGRDIHVAAQDVQDAINEAGGLLPRDLPYPPSYSMVNPADTPVVTLALTSGTLSTERLSDVADTLLAQRLSRISGVGQVTVVGHLQPAVRIQADLAKLAAYGLSLETLRTAVREANTNQPKGLLDGKVRAFSIGANDQLSQASGYRSVVVAYQDGAPVRLDHVARIVTGLVDDKVAAKLDGQSAVIVNVKRQPGANIVKTVHRLKSSLPDLNQAMPSGAKMHIVSDRTRAIRASVHEVQFTLVLSVVLVVLVILLFLRRVSATLIAGVTLPLSILATFGVMWFLGLGLNNLSLMALTIATGFVVDDAIVMIENIVRHLEAGEPPLRAAYRGAGEIGFTVISLTLSLIAVFIPLLLMPGIVGLLFREFALTLTVAVVTSAIVSLTLTPMLCSRLMGQGRDKRPGPAARYADHLVNGLLQAYENSLRVILRWRRTTLLLTLVTFALTFWLYMVVPKGFLPRQDTGVISARTQAGQGVSFAAMKEKQARVAAALRHDASVRSVVSSVGVGAVNTTLNSGHLSITLKPRGERGSMESVVADLKQRVTGIPGLDVVFKPLQAIQIAAMSGPTRYQYILTDSSADRLHKWTHRLVGRLRDSPGLQDVSSNLENHGPAVHVHVDRQVAGRLGVTMRAIDNTLYDAFGQRQISTIYGQANQYRVILEAAPRYQDEPSALASLYVPSGSGRSVPLHALAATQVTTAPSVVHHEQQFPAAAIHFDLASGASLGQAVDRIHNARQAIGMPRFIQGRFVGNAAEFKKSLRTEPLLILAAVIVIYIVLGVLYESFIHPFTILTTLPSAGVGALLALVLFDYDLTVVALIGLILLMGIVKKNAILMIDFALAAERGAGLPPDEAIFEASLRRFRPIMMTTIAALFGALPLVLMQGAGSALRTPLGVTIIGGLLLSQVMTLYTTPVIYLYMDGLKQRLTRRQDDSGRPRGEGLAPPAR